MHIMKANDRSYERVSWFYQRLAHMFSFGRIYAVKKSQIAELEPGQKVLYVGVGSGEDAFLAARIGCLVTCVDLSPRMLERTHARMIAAGLTAELICCDIMNYTARWDFDAVIANFFLNIFPPLEMKRVLKRLTSLVRPGGKLIIADFAPLHGNVLAKSLAAIQYAIADVFFWCLGLMPLHPVYDYTKYFQELGLELLSVKDVGIQSLGLCTYRSVVGVRGVNNA